MADQKIALIAPAEGAWGGYRAQDASGLRVDAWPADVPALLAVGFRPVDQPAQAADQSADQPALQDSFRPAPEPSVAEGTDSAGGAAV